MTEGIKTGMLFFRMHQQLRKQLFPKDDVIREPGYSHTNIRGELRALQREYGKGEKYKEALERLLDAVENKGRRLPKSEIIRMAEEAEN